MNDLLAMGFDEELAQAALRRSGGNVDKAIDLLLSSSVVSSDAPDHVKNLRIILLVYLRRYANHSLFFRVYCPIRQVEC